MGALAGKSDENEKPEAEKGSRAAVPAARAHDAALPPMCARSCPSGGMKADSTILAAPSTDPNQANNNGTTPLYIAAQEGYAGVAAQLLNAWLGTMPGAARS